MDTVTSTLQHENRLYTKERELDRYSDIMTYGHSRVKLNGVPDTDYINACFVDVSVAAVIS